MCKLCHGGLPAPGEGPLRRRKLWDIDRRLHCSVVGTCLTLGDLRRIAGKLTIPIPAHTEDYEVHASFVGKAGEPGPIARLMHKALERRYAAAIRRFDRLKSEDEIMEQWNRCREDGDVPGPFWALVTHPLTSENVAWRAFSHVHMLSHLVGSANRASIRQLGVLGQERDALVDELAKARRRGSERDLDIRRLVEQQAAEVRHLNECLFTARAAEQRLQAAEARLRELESGEAYQAIRTQLHALGRRSAEESQKAEHAAAAARALNREVEDLRRNSERLRERLDMVTAERDDLEAVLRAGLTAADDRTCPLIDLCGRRIVYVGGRTGLIPHLRALVERAGGMFIHQDGGIEENGERLGEILAQGDAVLCPVDCVSHGACRLAKRLCKQRSKPFVPLRSSGLSSFVSGLKEIAGESAMTETPAAGPMH